MCKAWRFPECCVVVSFCIHPSKDFTDFGGTRTGWYPEFQWPLFEFYLIGRQSKTLTLAREEWELGKEINSLYYHEMWWLGLHSYLKKCVLRVRGRYKQTEVK